MDTRSGRGAFADMEQTSNVNVLALNVSKVCNNGVKDKMSEWTIGDDEYEWVLENLSEWVKHPVKIQFPEFIDDVNTYSGKGDVTPDEILNGSVVNDNAVEVCNSILNARVTFLIDPTARKPLPVIPDYVKKVRIYKTPRDTGFRRVGGPRIIVNRKGTKVYMSLWTPFLNLILKNETPAIAYPFAKAMSAVRKLLNIPDQNVYIPTEEEQKRIRDEDINHLNNSVIGRQQLSSTSSTTKMSSLSDANEYHNYHTLPPVNPGSTIGRQPDYVQEMARTGMNVNTGNYFFPRAATADQINRFQQ